MERDDDGLQANDHRGGGRPVGLQRGVGRHVDMRIVRDYPAGTPAVAHIHAWLQQQSRLGTQPRQAPPPADAAALGAVRISTAIFDRPFNTRVDNISNAAPLPARGQPRDDITIDACIQADAITGFILGNSPARVQRGSCAPIGSKR
ncbi:hypothetical protein [Xanthomonas citri]|uniref:hypothetical protein n=1 Tax=Xanthomonas citri TaxID=346 RepID=UPI000B1F4313|nr:hypothetical protein [Xanthomonas citri]